MTFIGSLWKKKTDRPNPLLKRWSEKLTESEKKQINKLSTKAGGFPKVTKNGVWGDPRGATKKYGQRFLAEIVRNLVKECQS